MTRYKLICMSFDGDYVTERPEFETVGAAWEHCNDMGSRWYFYPFCFVVTDTLKTVVDTPTLLERFKGKRLATAVQEFKALSGLPEMQGMDAEAFAFELAYYPF